MKKILFLSVCILLAVLTACKNKEQGHAHQHASSEKYTCPMHPQVVQDGPGTCPICKMDLVPIRNNGAKVELQLSQRAVQLANIKTVKTGKGQFQASKVLNARIVNNPELSEAVSSRYAGRIEKLFVKETGYAVAAGQALFQIYSEQLQSLQQDYLLQVRQSEAFPGEKIYKDLKVAAAKKLGLFGFTQAQIRELVRNNRTSPFITVYSPASGIVNELMVSEGQYVSEGMSVMRLENYSSLWVEADIYPNESAVVKIGDVVKVRVNGLSGQEQESKIDFIAPQLNASTQILTVRAPLRNSRNLLQPGMQAEVFLPLSGKEEAIKLPLNAVIRDGKGAHVWVMTGNNKFALRQVHTGKEDDESILIDSGLSGNEEVVISGAYLLYSEFTLKKG